MNDFDICDELKPIISRFGCDNHGIINLTFTNVYNKITFNCVFTARNVQRFFVEFEKRLKKIVPRITPHDYNLIENTIYENMDKLVEVATSNGQDGNDLDSTAISSKPIQNIKYLGKYEFESILYEAIIVNKSPRFVSFVDGNISLVDKIEVGNYIIYPSDTIIAKNPIPYSFESEQEVNEYIEMAKNETTDSLFEKILTEVRKYINADEHTLVIISSDILYTYFQNKFGTTHYNIFVGDNNSGKNSALLVIRMIGYRPFYVTNASPANYYTFLGDVQEGQGIILEDEADNIAKSPDKKNMLKTGYCSGGGIPKVSFSKEGTRFQESYLTYSYKCFAMEELPGDKNSRGLFDRSFVHHFFKGNVPHNIKDIISDKESDLYKYLIHLRKILLAFKLVNYSKRFPEIKTNLTGRDAELTLPLLRMFYGCKHFENIRKALSSMIYKKTSKKSNSIEAKITETLIILGNNEHNKHKETIDFANEEFENTFKEIADTKVNSFDIIGSTYYLPDGSKISKYKILNLLRSKFNANSHRTNKVRGYSVIRIDVEKVSKQYEVIVDIIIYEDDYTPEKVTEVTQVTKFKDASTSFYSISNILENNHGERMSERRERSETDLKISEENKLESILKKVHADNEDNVLAKKTMDTCIKDSNEFDHSLSIKMDKNNKIPPPIPSKCVTSVTNVTATPPQYPCYFCGTNYQTYIDFDMGNHFVEKHKTRLIGLPISGNLETRIEWVINETKRRTLENAVEDQKEEDDEN